MIGFMLTIVGIFNFFVVRQAELHHDHRSDCYAMIIVSYLLCDKILDNLCNHTASSVGAVICGHVKITGYSFELFLKDDEIFGLCTDDDICVNAMLMQPFHLRVYRSCTYTACYKQNLLLSSVLQICSSTELRRTSQRSYEIYGKNLRPLSCCKFLCRMLRSA